MITSWDIYWITRLDSIQAFFVVSVFIIGSALLAFLVLLFAEDCWDEHGGKYFAGVAIFLCMLVGGILTPSTKEFAAIYLIPKITSNEQVQKLPDNMMKLLNGKLEEWIEDIGKTKPK
jgi:hypothetical protein